MTPTQKSQMRVGVVTAVVGGLLLLAFTKLSGQVVLRPELQALESSIKQEQASVKHQIQQTESNLERKIDETYSIALDNLCTTNPSHRRCRD